MKYASRFLYYSLLYYCIAAPIFEDKSVVKKFEPWFHCQTFHFTNHKCPWDFYMWSILPSLQVVANKDGCIWPKAISPDKYYFFSSEQILQREQNPFSSSFYGKVFQYLVIWAHFSPSSDDHSSEKRQDHEKKIVSGS